MLKRAIVAAVILSVLVPAASAHHRKRPMTDHRRIRILQGIVSDLRSKIAAQEKVAAQPPVFFKHAWPSLTSDEKSAITMVAKTLPKSVNFDIVCNDAGCSEMAADIDDALEDAGIRSGLDHAAGPLGYGLGITVNQADRPAAEKAVAMLKEATNGRLSPEIVTGQSPPGYVSIIIGKRPR